jgi:phage terminase large subunit-like protein
MGKHFNSKHDDAAWRALFGRWHAGEDSRALRREAGAAPDTWSAHAKRLGMRIGDLPEGHPAKRGAPAFADRADGYRHPKSLLTEGQWRALFALRAAGTPDTVLVAKYGVQAATICSQAKARGIRRADLRAGVDAGMGGETVSPPPSRREDASRHLPTEWGGDGGGSAAGIVSPPPSRREGASRHLPIAERRGGEGEAVSLEEAVIDPDDPEGTRAAFRAAIREAGRREDYHRIQAVCGAQNAMEKAFFAKAAGGGQVGGVVSPLHPAGPPPPMGEDCQDLVLRRAQRPPAKRADGSEWSTWLFLGGRGAGKTLAGASWISDMADRCGRLALIGATLHDAREVMIGGPSGILSLPRWRALGEWPRYQASRRRLVFPNGAEAFVFSAEDPDSLRGPQFAAAWADEFCAWRDGGEVLAMVRMGLRLPLDPPPSGEGDRGALRAGVEGAAPGEGVCGGPPPSPREGSEPPPPTGEDLSPRLCVTTTPRPTAALRALRAEASCEESHAPTADNAANLAPAFLEGLEALYGGTRRAAQELEGLVVEPEGGLFTSEMIAKARDQAGGYRPSGYLSPQTPGEDSSEGTLTRFDKVCVALDPTTTASGNACGIVVVARTGERAVVLADRSARGLSPEGWARRALAAAAEFGASEIVAEVNQGGEMVKSVLDAAGLRATGLRWRPVRATSGKRARAEPVAALYEQGRVRHAGAFPALEEELMAFGSEDEGRYDLDRADALVWGVTALLLGQRGEGPRIRSLDFGYQPRGLSVPLTPAWGRSRSSSETPRVER